MPCEYIFTHDDDLIFRIKQQFHVPKVSLPNLLINILKTYRPAIASFPWSTGDKSILAMRELALVYENETIAPLTGFDNGMVIYHKSIANFFIPFSPRGEGGFKGDWTLCAHFLQMFAHLLFEKYAIRLNMFEYNNSINMDNSLPENHFKQRILIKNGLAYVHDNLSWTKGIELIVNDILNANKPYDYIFTHDDDLTFHIKQRFSIPKTSLPNMLMNILETYQPAIAGFPWSTGDKSVSAMQDLASAYENETISPLTGFDNGMVIYHKSIINFFIPFSPRGEGGFRGEWTLCAHFLQMFAHFLFGKYALRLNMFEYNNSINMDNISPGNHFTQRIKIKNGLAYVRNSRHPYEYPQNEAYKSFLSDGLKFPYQAWGRTLTTEYRLETLGATDPKRKSFDGKLNPMTSLGHPQTVTMELLEDLFECYRTVVADNFFTSIALAKRLLGNDT
ncbi:unnamed protein product [Rotaria sp. Silwood2]|nr:unnamed protein product [Rotaria sp. Silwood2]